MNSMIKIFRHYFISLLQPSTEAGLATVATERAVKLAAGEPKPNRGAVLTPRQPMEDQIAPDHPHSPQLAIPILVVSYIC